MRKSKSEKLIDLVKKNGHVCLNDALKYLQHNQINTLVDRGCLIAYKALNPKWGSGERTRRLVIHLRLGSVPYTPRKRVTDEYPAKQIDQAIDLLRSYGFKVSVNEE